MSKPLWPEVNIATRKQCFQKINQREYQRVESAIQNQSKKWSLDNALNPINSCRNRYSNVLPWDDTRVKLPVKANKSDYINASYVNVDDHWKYIATQGPKNNTVHHFWSMALHEAIKNNEDSILVLMITPLIESDMIKCCKYWPDSIDKQWDLTEDVVRDGVDFNNLIITNDNETKYDDYTLTQLTISTNNIKKTIFHYYYYDWSDSKVPNSGDSLIQLLNTLNQCKSHHGISRPIIHCSAGVGRTGTFIALDYLFNSQALLSSLTDPIYDTLDRLRNDRLMMIQTFNQYNYLYDYFKARLGV